MKMTDMTQYRLLNVRFMLDYIKDPNPDNWRTISGAKVHLTNGKIDGGTGGKFNGKVYTGKNSKVKYENSLSAAKSAMSKNLFSGEYEIEHSEQREKEKRNNERLWRRATGRRERYAEKKRRDWQNKKKCNKRRQKSI